MPPGPTILSTRGTVSQASAATAWAPPILKTSVTSASSAAISASGLTVPSGRGGVTTTISRTPAIRAGMAFIKMVEGKASGLRGTQMPTFSMGVHRWPMTTPGRSARRKSLCLCRSWKRRMFSAASFRVSRKSGSTDSLAASNSAAATRRSFSAAPSKRRV